MARVPCEHAPLGGLGGGPVALHVVDRGQHRECVERRRVERERAVHGGAGLVVALVVQVERGDEDVPLHEPRVGFEARLRLVQRARLAVELEPSCGAEERAGMLRGEPERLCEGVLRVGTVVLLQEELARADQRLGAPRIGRRRRVPGTDGVLEVARILPAEIARGRAGREQLGGRHPRTATGPCLVHTAKLRERGVPVAAVPRRFAASDLDAHAVRRRRCGGTGARACRRVLGARGPGIAAKQRQREPEEQGRAERSPHRAPPRARSASLVSARSTSMASSCDS